MRRWIAVVSLVVLNAAILVLILRVREEPAPSAAAPLAEGLYVAWSHDGASWTPPHPMPMLTGDRAGHPRLAWISSRPIVVYESASGGGLARSEVGRTGVGHGFHLELSAPIRIDGEDGTPARPCLLQIPSGQYRLYYTSSGEVRSALSSDGISWRREPGTRLAGAGILDADVIMLEDGRYRLLHTLAEDRRVHSAVSHDGLDFAAEAGTRVDGGESSTMFLPSGGYQMLYTTPFALVASALSSDGLAFRPDEAFRAPFPPSGDLRAASASMTILTDGTWLMVCAYGAAARTKTGR